MSVDEIGAKVKAAAAAIAAAGLGVLFAPWLAKAAIIAVFLLILAVVAVARAHDMSVFEAAALYGSRTLVTVGKALAVCLVELPVRGAHRCWVRFDLPLRAEVIVAQLEHRAVDYAAQVTGWVRDSRAPRAPVRALQPLPDGEESKAATRMRDRSA